jgi:hypothetical protein
VQSSDAGVRDPLNAKELAFAALAFAALALAVLWRPISRLDTHVFGPFDVPTQATSITRLAVPPPPDRNPLLYDPATQMHAWAVHARRELAEGRLPLWNPRNACGAPLFANYQSAYLSPFTLPFFVLPLNLALVASGFLKLLALALATYAFLRTIGLARVAACAGAIAFATAGFQLLCLQYPHPGVFAMLPASLVFAERVLRRAEAGEPLRPGALLGFGAAVLVAALAGHPEPMFFCACVGALYVAGRAAWIARASPARAARAVGALALAALLGLAAAAIQILPFAEYLAASSARSVDRGASSGLVRANWPLFFFPDAVGTPIGDRLLAPDVPRPNYEEFTGFHVGSVAMLLAACALVAAWRVRATRAFVIALALWFVYAWDLLGVVEWLGKETPLRLLPVHRSHALWTWPIAVLAALGVDRAWRAEARSAGRAIAVLAAAALAWLAFAWGVERYVEAIGLEYERDLRALAASARAHMRSVSIAFAAGAAGFATLWVARGALPRALGAAAILAAMLAETAWPLAAYTPTVDARFVYPETPALQSLRSIAGRERVFFLTPDAFAADANLPAGVNIVTNYDALGVAEVDELAKRMLGGGYDRRMTLRASKKALQLFGLAWVAVQSGWVPIDTELGEPIKPRFDVAAELRAARGAAGDLKGLVELRAGRVVRTEIQASRDGLDAFTLQLADDPRSLARRVAVELIDVAAARVVARRELAVGDLPAVGLGRRELIVEHARQPASRGRVYAVELVALDATADAWARVFAFQGARDRNRRDGTEREIKIQLDLAYDRADFVRAGAAGDLLLYRFEKSLGRAWVVERALPAATRADALAAVESEAFDPAREVVVEGLDRERGAGAARQRASAEIVEEEPSRLVVRASCERPSFLVLAQSHYPGWRARIDGAETPLLRANYAFSAVELAPGEHAVEIEYAPGSLRWGAAISLAALALGCVLLLRLRRPERA